MIGLVLGAILLASVFILCPDAGAEHLHSSQEYEADIYDLNASRQPDGFAQAAIPLGEYRRMSPGRLEEWVFFDHPSGRIYAAMRWKA